MMAAADVMTAAVSAAKSDHLDPLDWQRLPATVRMRITLWRHADGHRCHWCGRATVLVTLLHGATMPADGATIDHLYPRGDPRRGRHRRALEQVLACYACNHARGNEEAALLRELRMTGVRVLAVVRPPGQAAGGPPPRRYRRPTVAAMALAEARAAAARVRESGLAEELSPRARRVRKRQHRLVQALGMGSSSFGDEPERRVVVMPTP